LQFGEGVDYPGEQVWTGLVQAPAQIGNVAVGNTEHPGNGPVGQPLALLEEGKVVEEFRERVSVNKIINEIIDIK
jgi:hypothetical protein